MNILKALTIRFEDDFHMELKLQCVKENVSIQEYVTNLIKEDMRKRKTNKKA